MNQHHVGGRRADHGPKHAPGVISGDGKPEMGDKGRFPQHIRSSAGEISRSKGLDRDIPVTEVWSPAGITAVLSSRFEKGTVASVRNQGRGRPVNSAVFFQTLDKKMTAELIEPLFREKFADFYLALQIPRSPAEKETPEEAEQCGRYIVNEIARNSIDVFTLLRGLRKWEPVGSISLRNPVEVAEKEHRTGNRAEIHFVSYRAIETLMSKSTPSCFAGVDLAAVREYLSSVKDRA